MAMVANRHREFIENLTELVEEGVIPMERIDDAVTRILRVKAAMGLLDAEASSFNAPFPEYGFGSEEHRAVSREAVQKSLVVLKNESALPLSKELTNIHVAGAAAEDMGIQCGGWTIGWQGEKGEVTTGGTTLLEGIRSVASDANVTHSATADGGDDADAVIVIVGEGPYAEGIGDNENPSLTEEEQAMIAQLSEGDRPLILVIVSGRPLLIPDDTLAAADAIVAAWLPGTEGDGVADVLFGDAPATGTLSFTWPRNKDQHPINVGDEEYDPLFPFGHGIQIEAAE